MAECDAGAVVVVNQTGKLRFAIPVLLCATLALVLKPLSFATLVLNLLPLFYLDHLELYLTVKVGSWHLSIITPIFTSSIRITIFFVTLKPVFSNSRVLCLDSKYDFNVAEYATKKNQETQILWVKQLDYVNYVFVNCIIYIYLNKWNIIYYHFRFCNEFV